MQLLELHRALLADQEGQKAYQKALSESIRAGDAVLDLGTGSGIHALFACRAGARKVYAVEQHEVIALAREVCRVNSYSDRISFIHASAEEVTLPEQVDLIVAHHGLGGLLKFLPSARDRFLKEGGRLVPSAVEILCAPMESPEAYREKVEFWGHRHYGLNFAPFRAVAVNTMHDRRALAGEILGEPVKLARLDFTSIKEPRLSETVEAKVVRPGLLHGVGVWYVEWLTDSVSLNTGPASTLPSPLWLNGFLPVADPMAVSPGEVISMKIQTGAGGWGKFWTWEVRVRDGRGREKARFKHSTFSGWILPSTMLRKQSLDHVPHLKPHGAALRFVLEACDGRKSIRAIEEEVADKFPDLFKSLGEAAKFVAEAISTYSA